MTIKFEPSFGFNTVDKAIDAAVKMAETANDVVYMTWNGHEFPVYKSAANAAYAAWSKLAYAKSR